MTKGTILVLILILFLINSITVFLGTTLSDSMPPMKGMTINAWSAEAYASSDFDQSITNLANIKANWVMLTVFWFMELCTDTEMHPRPDLYTASDSSLIHAIQKAHELNMKVALKPMVDIVDGKWRGQINPTNWTLWFENYRNFINFYADLAETNSVELFVVGTELRSSQTSEMEWRHVISEARTYFSRNITYAANWDSYNTGSIKFWDALDYVGVDAYFPLTNSYNPTLSQLISAWSYCTKSGYTGQNWTNQLYSTYTQTGKKIVFTEIGYVSQNGTNTQPWNWNVSLTLDLQEQADCYQAALEAFTASTWFEGWFWWNWETNPNAGKPGTSDEKHYTPQNKPAQNVLKYYYGGPPDIAVTSVVCSKSVVEKGDCVTINVTVENQGIYGETFNVTVYANLTAIQKQAITLTNGSFTTVMFTWNTTEFDEGSYTLSAYVLPLLFEIDTSDNTFVDCWVFVSIPGDVAVIDIFPCKNIVGQGYSLNVNATVENQGNHAETFNVTLYANTIVIQTQRLIITSKTSTTTVFEWNTTGFVKGNYTIKAYAEPVQGETDILDNNFTDGWVFVAMVGDVDANGKVDMIDLWEVARHFGIDYPDPRYEPNFDIDDNGKMDMVDVWLTAREFGKIDP